MYRIYLLLYFIHYGNLGLAPKVPGLWLRTGPSQANRLLQDWFRVRRAWKNSRVFGWFPGFQEGHSRCMIYRTHSIAFSLHQFSMENWQRVGLSRQCRKPLLRSDMPKGKHCGDKWKVLFIDLYLFILFRTTLSFEPWWNYTTNNM